MGREVSQTEDWYPVLNGCLFGLAGKVKKTGRGEWPGARGWLAGIPELGKGAVVMTNGQRGFDLSPKIIGALMVSHLWPMPDL